MARHTSFRSCLDLSVEQERVLSRHVGAARFAFNQALRLHQDARARAGVGTGEVPGDAQVPWTGFDLINVFNAWKRSQDAGRQFLVAADGTAQTEVTGLAWRGRVLAQVFEEAAVDLGRAPRAWNDSRTGARKGPRVAFPRFKKKSPTRGSFRIRNKSKDRSSIQVGDEYQPRSVSLPKIGTLRVREDTRRLRRMIAKDRARILFVTISRGANRWWISITVEAADLHASMRHAPRPAAGEPAGVDTGVDTGKADTRTVTDGAGRGAARAGDRQAAGPVTNAYRQHTPTHPGRRVRDGKGLDDVGTSQTTPAA